MGMNEHEDRTIDAFVLRPKRARYRELLGNPKKRGRILGRLNHTPDLDPRFVQALPGSTDDPDVLRQHGSPERVYLISCTRELDGQTLPLDEAVMETEYHGLGTIITPGRLER